MASQEKRSEGTIESLLRQVESIPEVEGTSSFEMWVPERLTLQGRRIPHDVALMVLLDALLARSFEPADFTEEEGGRLYRYQRSPAAEAG